MRPISTVRLFRFAFLIFAGLGISLPANAQNVTISGYMRDADTGESLIGGTVYVTTLRTGTVTNNYGFYSLTIPPQDSIGIVYSFIGYQPQIKKVFLKDNLKLDIALLPSASMMDEVLVTSERTDENVRNAETGVVDIPIRMIEQLPVILGERDVMKIIQLLPGVSSGSEGTTGFYVRGGNTDQNLVELDEAVVYNPSHLFGFFSAFNTGAINSVTLTKGGFPAKYGGRLSSIVEVTMREGNSQHFKTHLGLSLVSSTALFEGPIARNRGSFMVSARRSYLDLLMKPFQPKKGGTKYHFYDVNAKANYALSSKDRIYLSLFKGRDDASYTDASSLDYGLEFGNSTGTLRWNHLFSQKLFANTSLIGNTYLLNLSTVQSKYYSQVYSAIRDFTAKTDFEYFPIPSHHVSFGATVTNHRISPSGKSARLPKDKQIVLLDVNKIPPKYATEGAFYVGDDLELSPRVGLNLGLRVPFFSRDGASYWRMEPRATARVSLSETSSLKASFTEMNQFLHLVPSATASLPTDIWVMSSKATKPQLSRQVSVGYFLNLKDNAYETSVELYSKTMKNQVAFTEGTRLLQETDIESRLSYGEGWSKGLELSVRKNAGRFRGWLAYTLSKTDQRFPSLNYGRKFPFKYDRRHDLSIVGSYDLNDAWLISANFVASSGHAYTLPVGRFVIPDGGNLYDGIYDDYTGRNNYRLNPYHRLDLGLTYRKKRSLRGHPYDSELVFSFYNIYNHRNPYFVYLEVDAKTSIAKARQMSLLPVIPSISYNISF